MSTKPIDHIVLGTLSFEELKVVVIYMSAMVPELRSKLVAWLAYMAENKEPNLLISVPKPAEPEVQSST